MACKTNGMLNLMTGICIFLSCSTTTHTEIMHTDTNAVAVVDTLPASFLDSLMKRYPQYFSDILKNRKTWNVQVIYTQVNRGANGIPDLQHSYFNADAAHYFYPASTVKLPVVLLALQRLNELKDKGINKNTTMLTETAFSGQTSVFNDPTTVNGTPSIGHYIKKILLASDNDAYNRLYEFLGQDYINTEMKKKGYASAQILHRLNIFLSEDENRNTNPVKFYDSTGKLIYAQPPQKSTLKFAERDDSIGRGFYKDGKLVNKPMDFSKKNRISLEDLHKIMIGLVFPAKVNSAERFNITEDDRQFVLRYMSKYPTESLYPPYAADTINYWPMQNKFLLFGAEKGEPPANIRIFNKEGDAYGHLTDVAYVVDFKNKIEFFLSAVIYCNSDGILNDDKYDYETIGLPFMKNLGKVIYEYELKRNYKIRPDLGGVLFTYDK